MKTKSLTILILIFIAVSVSISWEKQTDKFYYAFDEKIKLTEVKNKFVIRYDKSLKTKSIAEATKANIQNNLIEWWDSLTFVVTTKTEIEKSNLMNNFKSDSNVYSCQSIYKIDTDLEMGVTDEILVKYLDETSLDQINLLNKKFNLKVIKTNEIYVSLKVPKGADALDISNKYYESGLVKFAHPNFLSKVEFFQHIPNDPYFQNQVAFHNTGQVFNDGHSGIPNADINAPEAWTMTKGSSNVIVAVIDEGVTSNHPDLPNWRQIRLNGSNFGSGDINNPSPTGNSNHGNSCAGVIAATQDNNEGISGVAPNCKIMPIRQDSNTSIQGVADAIRFAVNNGAHVISNSWGYSSNNPNQYPVIVQAIQFAVTQGRGGKGCVVVFAAGNNARHTENDNGYICFPANVNITGVLTVGASDRNDQQADYSPTSNTGSNNNQIIDIVAPSHRAYPPESYLRRGFRGGIPGETLEMWSIDMPNSVGYNPYPVDENMIHPPSAGEQIPNNGINFQSYTGRFGGTSHACPLVAGVAALILSVNPNFTQQDVFDILTTSTDRIGPYTYTNGRSNETGYGRLNACAAIAGTYRYASTMVGPSLVCYSGTGFFVSNAPDSCTTSWVYSSNLSIDWVRGATANFTAKGEGPGWLQASVNTICGSYTLPRKNVWVGNPLPAIVTSNQPYTIYVSGDISLYDKNLETYYYGINVNDFQWTWDSDGACCLYDMGPGQTMFWGAYPGSYRIRASVSNQCGTTDYYLSEPAFVEVIEEMYLSPNPANESVEVIVPFKSNTSDKNNSIPADKTYTVKVLTSSGVSYYSGKKTSSVFTLSTANLKNGTYIIEVSDGKDVYRKQLVVKH